MLEENLEEAKRFKALLIEREKESPMTDYVHIDDEEL